MMTDPIADMLTRIRNALTAKHPRLTLPASRIKAAIADVLKQEGYIIDYSLAEKPGNKKELALELRYADARPAITGMKRVSRSSRRVYVGANDIPRVRGGHGMAILSTSKGVMTGKTAEGKNLGGEILCLIW